MCTRALVARYDVLQYYEFTTTSTLQQLAAEEETVRRTTTQQRRWYTLYESDTLRGRLCVREIVAKRVPGIRKETSRLYLSWTHFAVCVVSWPPVLSHFSGLERSDQPREQNSRSTERARSRHGTRLAVRTGAFCRGPPVAMITRAVRRIVRARLPWRDAG